MSERILLVEDDPGMVETVSYALRAEGFDLDVVGDGDQAVTRALSEEYDLLLLDVSLPGLSGVEVCRRVREESVVPIVMVTARDAEVERVLGLESGADDYVAKPFGIRELLARVGAILRRTGRAERSGDAARRVQSSDIVLDADRRQAIVRGAPVELTKQEFDLLYQLASRPGIVFSRAALLSKVWSDDVYVTERTVDSVISRLRRKIERDAQDPEMILTAWGVGYKFADVT